MNKSKVVAGLLSVLSSIAIADNEFYDLSLEELSDYDIYTAPVLHSHIHNKGDFMASYHVVRGEMKGLGNNEGKLSTSSVLQDYMVAPTAMTMDMHMVHLMYAVTNKTTIMAEFHYMEMEMDHVTRMGGSFTTSSEGIGDTTLSVNYQALSTVTDRATMRYLLHAGLILPTGSIDEKDQTPMGRAVLPYPMQIGSGSHWLRLGGGYTGYNEKHAAGLFALAKLPLDNNTAGYKLSPELELNSWYQISVADKLSIGFSGDLEWRGSIDGMDARLNPNVVPTADTDNYGRTLFWSGADITYELAEDAFIGVSAKAPIWQDLRGPQLRNKTKLELKLEVTL